MANLKAREGHEAEVRREGVERLAAAVRAAGGRGCGHRRRPGDARRGHRRARADDASPPHRDRRRRVLRPRHQAGRLLDPRGADAAQPDSRRAAARSAPTRSSASATARSPAPRRSPVASWGRPASHTAGSARCSPTRSSPPARGRSARRAITKSLELRYLRPLPLDEEIELWGVCVPTGDDTFRARFRITARGKLAVEGSAGARVLRELLRARLVERMTVRRAPPSPASRTRSGGRSPRACSRACRSRPRRSRVSKRHRVSLRIAYRRRTSGSDRSCTSPSTSSGPWYTPWPQPSRRSRTRTGGEVERAQRRVVSP